MSNARVCISRLAAHGHSRVGGLVVRGWPQNRESWVRIPPARLRGNKRGGTARCGAVRCGAV
eukprot:4571538-Prymnesium_polylepis.1